MQYFSSIFFFLKVDKTNPTLFDWLFFILFSCGFVFAFPHFSSSSSLLFFSFYSGSFPLNSLHFLLHSLLWPLSHTSVSNPERPKFCFLSANFASYMQKFILYFCLLHLLWQINFLFQKTCYIPLQNVLFFNCC